MKNENRHYLKLLVSVFALIALCFSPTLSFATYIEVDFTEYNHSLNNMANGWYYGTGGSYDYNGIPLTIADGTNGSNNIWLGRDDPDGQMTISTSISNANRVYTLINSWWGYNNSYIGKLEFFGTNGAYYKYDLIEGWNVRDHYNDGFVNYTNDPTTIDDVISPGGGVRLDMQVIDLPSVFESETLTSITITNLGGNGYPTGTPFMAALTVSANPVPEPSTFLLFGIGLLGVAAYRKKSRMFE